MFWGDVWFLVVLGFLLRFLLFIDFKELILFLFYGYYMGFGVRKVDLNFVFIISKYVILGNLIKVFEFIYIKFNEYI